MKIVKESELSETARVATRDEMESYLRVREEPTCYNVILEEESELHIKIYVRGAKVIETQKVMESFIDIGNRKRKEPLKFRVRDYYKEAWTRWVVKTEPLITYNQLKHFKESFNKILQEIFPDPYEMFSESAIEIDEDEEKNSG